MTKTDSNHIDLVKLAAKALYDKKSFNVVALDLKGVSPFTDAIVVAEGSVDRHVSALAHSVYMELKEAGHTPINVDGEGSGWIVLDYFNVMIHIFTPEMRQRYQVEQIWKKGEIIPVAEEPAHHCNVYQK